MAEKNRRRLTHNSKGNSDTSKGTAGDQGEIQGDQNRQKKSTGLRKDTSLKSRSGEARPMGSRFDVLADDEEINANNGVFMGDEVHGISSPANTTEVTAEKNAKAAEGGVNRSKEVRPEVVRVSVTHTGLMEGIESIGGKLNGFFFRGSAQLTGPRLPNRLKRL